MSNINFYNKIPKKYLTDKYYNPNAKDGALIHPFRCAIIGSTGSMKTNSMMNIIASCNCFEKYYLIARNLQEPLYQFFIETMATISKKTGENVLEYSNEISDLPSLDDDIDVNKQNLVILDDIIGQSDLKKDKKLLDLFIRGRKSNCSVIFISQNYFSIPKIIRGQCSYFILKKINNKKDLGLIVAESSLDKTVEQLYEIYKNATKEQSDFFLIDANNSDETQRYRKNFGQIESEQKLIKK